MKEGAAQGFALQEHKVRIVAQKRKGQLTVCFRETDFALVRPQREHALGFWRGEGGEEEYQYHRNDALRKIE